MNTAITHRLKLLRWVVGVGLVVGAVFWWRAAASETPMSADDGSVSQGYSTGLTLYRQGERPAAPELAGTTLTGDRLSLADLAGHVVVVNVWGSWCSPCRAEAPDLARLARQTASRGVRFVGVDTRDTTSAAKAFVRNFHVPYPSLIDSDGQVMLAFQGLIPISAVPSTVVIDADGRIAAKIVGSVTYSTLRGLVKDELPGHERGHVTRGGS